MRQRPKAHRSRGSTRRRIVPCALVLATLLGAEAGGLLVVAADLPEGREGRRHTEADTAPASSAPFARARPDASPGPTPAHRPAPPELGPIPSLTLVAGRPWRLRLRGRELGGERPRIDVRGLPPGARLTTLDDGGWHLLDWTPPSEAEGTLEITLVAIDRHRPRLTTERALRLEIRTAVLEAGSGRSARHRNERATFEPTPVSEPTPVPTIDPLPAQIVSAGHVVRLRIRARLDDARRPRLSIDRLPTHASFDEHADGSRTLYWPTARDDEGEHRFRITARHPDDGTRASTAEVLIVVGDPSRGASRPGVPFVSAPTAPGTPTPTGTAGTVTSPAPAAAPEPVNDDVERRTGEGVHDPYDTYDDHPPYDPHAAHGTTLDSWGSGAGSSNDDRPAGTLEYRPPEGTLDESDPNERHGNDR